MRRAETKRDDHNRHESQHPDDETRDRRTHDDGLSRPLRVMTYNVRYFGHATRGLASTANTITRIARSIANLSPLPDLVCLQEVETQSIRSLSITRRYFPEETQLDRLMTELTAALRQKKHPDFFTAYYFPAHKYSLTKNTNIYTTGLAVLANRALSAGHHNAESPHDITHRRLARRFKQTRICAHAAFEREDGLRFDVFNTHLSLPSFLSRTFWTGEARMGFGKNQLVEAEELLSFVHRAKKSENFFIVGDFNSLPGSPVDRFLREKGGLVDAFRATRGDPPDHEARAFGTAGFLNLRMHLDHVYSSPNARWLDFSGTEKFGGGGDFEGLSDHVPLIGRCRFE
ncbi:MAG: endonuclease/exonuclease/phosphatase family protein [Polyangiaceae bacterium]|nr:endonuclease/exonuclease/phosphatase family protein [Polyangiaceae bacterium]